MTTASGLVVREVQARYPNAREMVLRGVNLVVAPGQALALVGGSGSGKSTLARIIAGLQAQHSGQILLDGVDLSQLTAQQRGRQVQMIFQDPSTSLDPRWTIGEAIAEPLLGLGLCKRVQAKEQAATWLERVGLRGSDASRYPHTFSGGQLQRIAIARALCVRPRLLIADEAVSALDVVVAARICELLEELRSACGSSLLFITHDLAVAWRLCSTIAVLDHGTVVEQGNTTSVLQDPQHPSTQRLVQATQALRGHVAPGLLKATP